MAVRMTVARLGVTEHDVAHLVSGGEPGILVVAKDAAAEGEHIAATAAVGLAHLAADPTDHGCRSAGLPGQLVDQLLDVGFGHRTGLLGSRAGAGGSTPPARALAASMATRTASLPNWLRVTNRCARRSSVIGASIDWTVLSSSSNDRVKPEPARGSSGSWSAAATRRAGVRSAWAARAALIHRAKASGESGRASKSTR